MSSAVLLGRVRIWLSLAALAAGAALLAASALARPAAPGGGTLRVAMPIDVDYVDPALAYYLPSWQIEYATCMKLVNFADASGRAGLRLVPEGAALPRISANGRVYTFRVRSNLRFSDGTRITARNFEYALNRSLNKRMTSPAQPFFEDIVGAKAVIEGNAQKASGIRVLSGSRLQIRLMKRAPTSSHASRCPSRARSRPTCRSIPTVSPPRSSARVRTTSTRGSSGARSRSAANPFYAGPRPHRLDAIEYAIGLSAAQAFDQVESGEADWLPGPSWSGRALQERFATSPRARHARGLAMRFLIFNTSTGPLANSRLRRAVSYALDRTAIVTAAGPLSGRPADHYVPRGVPGHDPRRVYPLRADLTKARELARGLVPVRVFMSPTGPPQVWQEITRQLAAIDVTIEPTRYSLCGPAGHMHVASLHADYGDPAEFVRPLLAGPTGCGWSGWQFDRPGWRFVDPQWQQRFEQANRFRGAARLRALGRFDVALARDAAPAAALYAPEEQELFSDRVGCFRFHPIYVVDLAALCLR